MKKCLYCGKELTTEQRHNLYCSMDCFQAAKKEKTIKAWLSGENIGNKTNGQISQTIRNYLLEKANYRCEVCGWGEINPVTKKVPLEIHHIDGDYLNNRPENLQVLCPNCHSLTPNFKALNQSDRVRTQVRKENHCIDCGAIIQQGSIRCKRCDAKSRVTEKPVTREDLKKMIRTTPFTTIGKQLGVSDNAIRKWCVQYGLPSKKYEIKALSDKEWEDI